MQFETQIGRIEMAKSFGSVVLLVRGPVTVNALVVQSVQQADGEHLTVVYLDPDKASPLLSGQSVDLAIKREFAVPLTEGKTFGWKDVPESGNWSIGEPVGVVLGLDKKPLRYDASPVQEPSPILKAAADTIEKQADKITELRKELGELTAKLQTLPLTSEEIDAQAKAAAYKYFEEVEGKLKESRDALRPLEELQIENQLLRTQLEAKEAAPEAIENPTSTGLTPDGPTEAKNPSETNTSEVGSLSPSPNPESHSSGSSQDSGTSEPESSSDNPLPG